MYLERQILGTTLLTAASLLFAWRAVVEETATGEPALRGLVHSAIGGLFGWLLWQRPENRVAHLFCLFGYGIGAGAAWTSELWVAAAALLAGAAEALSANAASRCASGLHLAVGAALLTSRVAATERLPFVFHAAFTAALGEGAADGGLVRAVVAMTLALYARTAPVAPILALSGARAAWAAWRDADASTDDGRTVATYVAPHRAGSVAAALYGATLALDAWSRGAHDPFVTTTRMLHVAAVVGALLYLLPPVCAAHVRVRYGLTVFPLFDIALCSFRLRHGGPALLYARAAGAGVVAVSLHLRPRRLALDVRNDSQRPDDRATRAAIGFYVLTHVGWSLDAATVDRALAILFHHVVVIAALAWTGLEAMDLVAMGLARVFLAMEGLAMLGLVVTTEVDRAWTTMCAVAAAILLERCMRERGANQHYTSALLAFDDPDDVPDEALDEARSVA